MEVIKCFIETRMGRSIRNNIGYFLALVCVIFNIGGAVANAPIKYQLTGVVKDAYTHKPISAAQISTMLEKQSAVTDDKGVFVIKSILPNEILSVTAYDHSNVEIAVLGKDSIIIELYSDTFTPFFKSVENVGGVNSSSQLINNVATAGELKHNNSVTVDDLIHTKMGANVRSITRSGTAGIGNSLFIRGINSLNADAQPLFVVDGIVWTNQNDYSSVFAGFFSNPLDVIDVNDIEDISVVKDGASIYGSKAANGVVIIKTKHATSMVTKIGVNIFKGFTQTPSDLPMMGGEDFRIYASELLGSKGVPATNDFSSYGFFETNKNNKKTYKTYHNNTNWNDQVYQTSSTNNYMINASGGDEKAMYYFSLGLMDNKGVVKTTDLTRINSRFNADFKMFKYLDMGLNIGYSYLTRTLMDDGANRYSSPTWMALIKSPLTSPFSYTNTGNLSQNISPTDIFDVGNPVGLLKYSVNSQKKYRFNITASPTFKFSSALSLSSLFDYSIYKIVEGRFAPMTYTPVEVLEGRGLSYNEVNSQVVRNTNVFDETKLTYQKSFGILSQIKGILGFRYINNYYESDYAEEHNTGANNITTITGDHDFLYVDGLNNYTKSLSNFASIDYSYSKSYLLNASVSMDASSRFGSKTKGGIEMMGYSWGVFPSVNAAWIVSNEPFMKNVDFIQYAKIKVGAGLTGNDGLKDYASRAYFKSVHYMDKASGMVLTNLENPTLQWETTMRNNIGAELNVLKNRVSLSFDYFMSKTSDLLVLKDYPEVVGIGQYWTNDGTLKNTGFELSINAKMINTTKFKWELGVNVGHYKNKITSLLNGEFSTPIYDGLVLSRIGESQGAFYGFKTKGVFSTQAEANAAGLRLKNADGSFTSFNAGDVIFQDNGDKVIDEGDRTIIGNSNPDLYGNVNTKFTYGRLALSGIFTYSYGNDIYNYKRSLLESGKDFSNQTTAMLGRWTADGQTTTQPKAMYGDPMGNSRFSDRWIEDGSYIKLKNVTLSYDFPIKSDYIEGINLWVSATNLFTLTKYLGSDPEFSAGNSVFYQGVDAGLVPQTKSYYVGIKLNL